MLVVIKVDGNRNILSSLIKTSSANFQRLIFKFFKIYHEWCYGFYIKGQIQKFTIENLHEEKVLFKTFSKARYATDVIFQMSNRSCGNMREKK